MLCFLVVNMQSLWSLLLLGMLCGSGHAICVPTISALMLESFPNESRGMGSTLTIMFSDMGMIVGAPVMGTIAATFGYEYLFVAAGLIIATTTIYFGWMTIPGWYKKRNAKENQPRWEPSLFPFEKKESRPVGHDSFFAPDAAGGSTEPVPALGPVLSQLRNCLRCTCS